MMWTSKSEIEIDNSPNLNLITIEIIFYRESNFLKNLVARLQAQIMARHREKQHTSSNLSLIRVFCTCCWNSAHRVRSLVVNRVGSQVPLLNVMCLGVCRNYAKSSCNVYVFHVWIVHVPNIMTRTEKRACTSTSVKASIASASRFGPSIIKSTIYN